MRFNGLTLGVFAGELEFTAYKGSNLLRQEAIASTEEPAVAYIYKAGLKGFPITDDSKDFTESVPEDPNPGGGSSETTVQSFSKTSVGKYQAFQVSQINDDSESTGIDINLNTLVAVAGTDVFYIMSIAFTNDPISTAVMRELISRVQKLR